MSDWIAVTGGCGYIGSHIACELKEKTDLKVLIIDRAASTMPHTHWLADELVDDDIVSDAAKAALLAHRPRAIIHCAGTSLVGPSLAAPADYYDNNVVKTIQLLDFMRDNGLNNLIFSSSAAVYGESWAKICDEDQIPEPINPYGNTKAIIETILRDYGTAYNLSSVSFRYFNAAGADPQARLGQAKDATHLLARIMESTLYNKDLVVYGNKYPTKDGTCVRDYAHVCDIARAHVLAIDHLRFNPGTHVLNLGSGNGTTVLEMIEAVGRVTNHLPAYTIGDARFGDPAILIADIHRADMHLGWQPAHTLDDIVEHARGWYLSDYYDPLKTSI
jgi:UDP-glucose-4-epimerase GalE